MRKSHTHASWSLSTLQTLSWLIPRLLRPGPSRVPLTSYLAPYNDAQRSAVADEMEIFNSFKYNSFRSRLPGFATRFFPIGRGISNPPRPVGGSSTLVYTRRPNPNCCPAVSYHGQT